MMSAGSVAVAVFVPAPGDPQSRILIEEIAALGGTAVELPVTFTRGRKPLELTIADDALVLGERLPPLGAVFLRGLGLTVPAIAPPYLSSVQHAAWRVRYQREQIRQRLLRTFCLAAAEQGALIVNPPETYYQHDTKAQLARTLRQHGLPVPDSIGTNDGRALAGLEPDQTVVKAGLGVGATRALEAWQLAAHEQLRDCPALFQARIVGPTLRIHTVGERIVLALRVHAETLDSRSSPTGVEVVQLGPDDEALLARANHLLGLHYAAWDAIRTAHGLVLLDCNPGPYIGWIGERFTRHVLHQVARFLLRFCATQTLDDARSAVQTGVGT